MKKIIPVLLATLLLLSLAACNTSSPAGPTQSPGISQSPGATQSTDPTDNPSDDPSDIDPFAPFDETVSLTQTRILATWMGFDEGENEDNNWWTRTYKERLNIELTNLFTAPNWGPDFDAKINVALATDDLPDVMGLYTSLAAKAIEGGKVMDLTEVFDKYASPQIKAMYENDPLARKAWTVDGKLYGLAPPAKHADWGCFWIPQSMIDELNGGKLPANFAEIEDLARKIKDKTGSYAIGLNNELEMLEYLTAMYHGTYAWIEKDGNHVHHLKRQGLYADAWFGALHHVDFYENDIHDCEGAGIVVSAEEGQGVSDVRIYGNRIYGNHGTGILFGTFGADNPRTRIDVFHNDIRRNGHGVSQDEFPYYWITGGLCLLSANVSDCRIFNNILEDNCCFDIGCSGRYLEEGKDIQQILAEKSIRLYENLILSAKSETVYPVFTSYDKYGLYGLALK